MFNKQQTISLLHYFYISKQSVSFSISFESRSLDATIMTEKAYRFRVKTFFMLSSVETKI